MNNSSIELVNYLCEKYDINSLENDFLLFLSVAGIFLNCICLTVMVKPQMDSVFNRLLSLLAVSDIFFLVAVLFLYSTTLKKDEHFCRYLTAIAYICAALSTMTTLAVSVERCLAVYFPYKCNNNNIDQRSRRRAFFSYLLPVMILSFVVHGALFVEGTDYSHWKSSLQTFGLVLKFVGVFILVALNITIYQKLSKVRNSNSFNILLYIASSSFIMYAAFFIFNIIKSDVVCASKELQKHSYVIVVFLFVINSSCNFFIYNWNGNKFRKTLAETWILKKYKAFLKDISSLVESNQSYDTSIGSISVVNPRVRCISYKIRVESTPIKDKYLVTNLSEVAQLRAVQISQDHIAISIIEDLISNIIHN